VKILMIVPQPFIEKRDVPLAIYDHIKALILMGFEIDLVTYAMGKDIDLPGLRIFRIPRLPLIHQVKDGPSLARFPLDLLVFFLAFWRLCHNRYDALHTHEEAGLMGIILSATFGKRHLYYTYSNFLQPIKGSRFTPHGWLIRLTYAIKMLTIRYSDSIITIRPDVMRQIQERSPYIPVYLIEQCTPDMQDSWLAFLHKSLQVEQDFTGEKIQVEQDRNLNEAKAIDAVTTIQREKVEETTCVA
jgi:hypothetical protein